MDDKIKELAAQTEQPLDHIPTKPHHFLTKKVAILGIGFLLTAVISSVGTAYILHKETPRLVAKKSMIVTKKITATPTSKPTLPSQQTFSSLLQKQASSSASQASGAAFLQTVTTQFPSTAIWEQPQPLTKSYDKYQDANPTQVSGVEIQGSDTVQSFENMRDIGSTYLTANGWELDNQIAADGPTGSTWGYKKATGNNMQILELSYTNNSLNAIPGQPVQSTCPCNVTYSVFLSDPF